jgi:hypothetical protein
MKNCIVFESPKKSILLCGVEVCAISCAVHIIQLRRMACMRAVTTRGMLLRKMYFVLSMPAPFLWTISPTARSNNVAVIYSRPYLSWPWRWRKNIPSEI